MNSLPNPMAAAPAPPSVGDRIRDAVFEPHPAPVNRFMIAAQVVVFALGLYTALTHNITLADYLSTGRSPLTERLVVSPAQLARGEWWVLITAAFVHVGWLHLVVNLVSMGALGPTVEGMLGSRRYLVLWLLSAMGGSVLVALRGQSAAGSSGVVCGLVGALAAFFALYHRHIGRHTTARFREWLVKTTVIVVAFSLLPWVSGAAHLGGAMAGAVAGALLAVQRFGPPLWRLAALAGVVALPAASAVILLERGIVGASRTPEQSAALESAVFALRSGPELDAVVRRARAIDDDLLERMRALPPGERPRDQVRSALAALNKLRAEQSHVLTLLIQTGQYRTPTVELCRRAAGTLLEYRLRVTQYYEECLRRGDQWALETDENALQSLLNVALEAEIAYQQAAKRVLALRSSTDSIAQGR